MAKTACPITRSHFAAHAKAMVGKIAESLFGLSPNARFSTGSMGWQSSSRMTLDVGGVPADCMVNVIVTVIGSKEAAE